MKKNYTQLILLLAGIFNLLATGCASSDTPAQPENNNFSFYIKMPDPITVETKADIGTADEPITVNDVWILQYLANGTLSQCLYIDDKYKITSEDNNYLVKIQTPENEDQKFSDVESRFYIIVNGGAGLLNDFKAEAVVTDKTEAALKKIMTYIDYNYQATNSTPPGLLTAGPIAYKPTTTSTDAETYPTKADEGTGGGSETGTNDGGTNEGGTNEGSNGEENPAASTDKVVFISRMYRAYAKVKVDINFQADEKFPNSSFTVTECTVNNLPSWGSAENNTIALYTPAITDAGYPTTDKVTESLKFSSSNSSFSFYMPENLRGIGKSTSFEDKNKTENGPGRSLEGCTFLTVKGDYIYDSTKPSQNPIKVEYTFYLGGNLTNDYNIERDHLYNLTLNLKGANSADWRVKITDGNVAVFDEVTEINNKVDF